jgi:hypothetical protein
MKNFLLCLTVSSFLFNLSVAQETSVLFIGNSYIYTANLPGTLKSLALAGGDSIYHESSTPGGYTFEGHSTNASTLSKISSRNWDFVVLQQQSQMPSFPPSQVASQTYPFAEILVDSIKSNYTCSEPVFFMTWGRRDGDQSNCAGYPPLCTFEGMNARLRQSYLEMGADNDATVAPCGAAWHQMSLDNNSFWSGLYSGDGSHPSAWGTYLNACVFYATIFRKSPVGIPFYSNIGQQDAEDLQQLAEDIVLDSLSNWYIGHQDVVSNATYTYENGFTVNFDGSSENETSHEWDFGDGSESTQESPQYMYPTNGIYEVTHIATSLCDSDTTSFDLLVQPLGIEKNPLKQIEVFAANGALTVKNVLNSNIQIELMDLTGRVVLKSTVNSKATNSVQIPAEQGIYLVQLTEGELQWTKKVFIN